MYLSNGYVQVIYCQSSIRGLIKGLESNKTMWESVQANKRQSAKQKYFKTRRGGEARSMSEGVKPTGP